LVKLTASDFFEGRLTFVETRQLYKKLAEIAQDINIPVITVGGLTDIDAIETIATTTKI
jgi:phosphoribosylformimino-5-aminoimidazole carboxamide ribonucleotide (ProFAR) isomerase